MAVGLVRRQLDEAATAATRAECLEPRLRQLLAEIFVVLAVEPERRNARRRTVAREQFRQAVDAAGLSGVRLGIAAAPAGEIDRGEDAREVLRRERDRDRA